MREQTLGSLFFLDTECVVDHVQASTDTAIVHHTLSNEDVQKPGSEPTLKTRNLGKFILPRSGFCEPDETIVNREAGTWGSHQQQPCGGLSFQSLADATKLAANRWPLHSESNAVLFQIEMPTSNTRRISHMPAFAERYGIVQLRLSRIVAAAHVHCMCLHYRRHLSS